MLTCDLRLPFFRAGACMWAPVSKYQQKFSGLEKSYVDAFFAFQQIIVSGL
jgi:hypothetical protein